MSTHPLFKPTRSQIDSENITKIASAVYAIDAKVRTNTVFVSYEPNAILGCCIKWGYEVKFNMGYDNAVAFLGEHLRPYLTARKSKDKFLLTIRSSGSSHANERNTLNSHYYLVHSLAITMVRDYHKFLAADKKFIEAVRG